MIRSDKDAWTLQAHILKLGKQSLRCAKEAKFYATLAMVLATSSILLAVYGILARYGYVVDFLK